MIRASGVGDFVMVTITIDVEIEEEVMEVLQAMAVMQKITVEEVLRGMVAENLQRIKERMNDPIIGMINSGRSDISEHDEDILQAGWRPD